MSTLKNIQTKFGFWLYKNRNPWLLLMIILLVASMIYFFVMNISVIRNMTQDWSYIHAIPFCVVAIIFIFMPLLGLKNWNENYLIVIYEAKNFSEKLKRDKHESFRISNKLYNLIDDAKLTKNSEKLTRWMRVHQRYERYMKDLKEKSELLEELPSQVSEVEKNAKILWDSLME